MMGFSISTTDLISLMEQEIESQKPEQEVTASLGPDFV